jgi:hypothetical protein
MLGPNAIDVPHDIFWQYMEASVANLMASLTAYRTMFVLTKENTLHKERMKRPTNFWRKCGRPERMRDEEEKLSEISHATLTGMRTIVEENNMGECSESDAGGCGKKESNDSSPGSSQGGFITPATV